MRRTEIDVVGKLRLSSLAVSLMAMALASLFLVTLLRWSHEQVIQFILCLTVLFPVLFASALLITHRDQKILGGYWKETQAGQRIPDSERVREAYATTINHPRLQMLLGIGFWTMGTAIAGAYMAIFHEASWYDLFKVFFAGFSAGLLSSLFSFFMIKGILRPVAASFQAYRSVEGLARSVTVLGLRVKLLVTFLSLVLVPLSFSGLMIHEKSSLALERLTTDLQEHTIVQVARRLREVPPQAISSETLRRLAADSGFEPKAGLAVLGPTGRILVRTGQARMGEEPMREALRVEPGDRRTVQARHVVLDMPVSGRPWRVVLFVPLTLIHGALAVVDRNLAVLTIFALVIAMAMSLAAAGDLSRALGEMVDWTRRVAQGDLGAPLQVESEDELGELSWSLNGMSRQLQDMILHVRRTSEGVETMSAGLRQVSREVMESSDEQSSGVLEATSVIEEMNASIKGIAENTDRLSVSAEESSSSILEMGATVEEVNGNVESLGRSVEQSVASVEQMAGSIREVARNAEGLADVAEETSSAMEEMVASIRQVEGNAAETKRLSGEVVEAAEQGREKVSATIDGIEAIRSATEEAGRVIESLGGRAQEIGEILNVIDEVAEETNLLALNAAIIAAQAGEHGRGFSVVADEIKDLAERVGVSTKEIGKLIRAVQEESGNAVSAVRRGSEMVATGVKLSREAGSALEGITASARRSGEMVGEIASATTEQSKGSMSVMSAMERVRDMTAQIRSAMEEQARGSEQVMHASESMREVATQVRETIREQSRGSGRITTNIENIREMVDQINHAIQEQRRGTETAVTALERIRDRTERNVGAASRMSDEVSALVQQADALKAEVSRFKSGTTRREAGVPASAPPAEQV